MLQRHVMKTFLAVPVCDYAEWFCWAWIVMKVVGIKEVLQLHYYFHPHPHSI